MTPQSFCECLRAASEPGWEALLTHRFVTELADGTLALARFRFYLEQDRLYLLEFARVIALAAARAGDEAQLRWFAGVLGQTLDGELAENERLLARLRLDGVADHRGARELSPAAAAYTGWLYQVGLRGSLLDLTVALLPCPWSYAEIGRRYAGRANGHPHYRDWLAYQGSAEARAFADEMIGLVHAEVAGMEAVRFDSLSAVFATATGHELAFWNAAYALGAPLT